MHALSFQEESVTCYNPDLRIAVWVACRLTKRDINLQRAPRRVPHRPPPARRTNHVIAIVLPNDQPGHPVPPGTQGVAGARSNAAQADAFPRANVAKRREIETATDVDFLPAVPAAV